MTAAIDRALHYELINAGGVASIIAAREYPAGEVPSSAPLPYVTHQLISSEIARHQTAESNLASARYQVTSWAASSLAALTLADAVHAALAMMSGSKGAAGSKVTIDRILPETAVMEIGWPETGGEKGTFGMAEDFTIWYRT
jgi:hypothetical protein